MEQVKIKYLCQHLTCRMQECHEGVIELSKDKFDMFCQNNSEAGCFTSPSRVCKIGHTQTFKILQLLDVEEKELNTVPKLKAGSELSELPIVTKEPEFLVGMKDFEKVVKRIDKLEKRLAKIEDKKKGPKVKRKDD